MHNLHAIILRAIDCNAQLAAPTISAPLPQGYCLVPVNDHFHLSKCGTEPPSVVENFEFLTPEFQAWLKSASVGRTLVYIETDYFGGAGGQGAAVFSDGVCISGPTFSDDGPINEALRVLGVSVDDEELDEFEALGLGRHRSTAQWLATES